MIIYKCCQWNFFENTMHLSKRMWKHRWKQDLNSLTGSYYLRSCKLELAQQRQLHPRSWMQRTVFLRHTLLRLRTRHKCRPSWRGRTPHKDLRLWGKNTFSTLTRLTTIFNSYWIFSTCYNLSHTFSFTVTFNTTKCFSSFCTLPKLLSHCLLETP